MWPINLMFFLFPAIVIILVFFLLPYIGKKYEPFGFKTKSVLPNEIFTEVMKVYQRKLFLFSIPLTIAVSVANMYILSTFMGSFMLGTFILLLAGINFLFFMQGHKVIKAALTTSGDITPAEGVEDIEKNELPKWWKTLASEWFLCIIFI